MWRRKKRRGKTSGHSIGRSATQKRLEAHIVSLQSQVQTINTVLQQHSATLFEHRGILDDHSGRFLKLEQLVERPVARLPPSDPSPKPPGDISATRLSSQKCNIESFSPQEKRILQVFFQNPEMHLSYIDIGRALGKSPNTIKNQVHQIRIKADLFDKTIDAASRNRFRLKEGIRLEKYLNMG